MERAVQLHRRCGRGKSRGRFADGLGRQPLRDHGFGRRFRQRNSVQTRSLITSERTQSDSRSRGIRLFLFVRKACGIQPDARSHPRQALTRLLYRPRFFGTRGATEGDMSILVVGATGLVGGQVAQKLRRQGESVRAFVRGGDAHPKAQPLRAAGIEIVAGDLTVPETLAPACRGIATVALPQHRCPREPMMGCDAWTSTALWR